MDVRPTIRLLQIEVERIEAAIAQLEQLQSATSNENGMATSPNHKSKRGRKSMEPEERLQVSERMKKYWVGRRKAS